MRPHEPVTRFRFVQIQTGAVLTILLWYNPFSAMMRGLSLFLRKKSNQKSRRKTNTPRFPVGALMKLSCYCDFSFISLLLSHR